MSSKEELRKVEIYRLEGFRKGRLSEVKQGERFRMWESDGEYLGEWVAEKDAFLSNNGPNGTEVWTVEVDNERKV
jgi:hypothetical protein